MSRLLIILAVTLLPACASRQPVLPKVPETVTVVVEKYVTVPEELTEACPLYEPKENTYFEAKRLALLRRESLEACNRKLAQIRALSGEKP
jgi:hypothetical protein